MLAQSGKSDLESVFKDEEKTLQHSIRSVKDLFYLFQPPKIRVK